VQSLTNSGVTSIVVGLLIVVLVTFRQLRTSSVREERGVILYFVILAVGIYQTIFFLQAHVVDVTVELLIAASIVIGLGLGVLRGFLTHLWRADGKLLRRGNAWTILVWIVGLGIHLGLDIFTGQIDPSAQGFASATLLVYVALSLGTQRFVLLRRAKFIVEHPNEAPTHY
jgi:hypothetical protein